MRAEKTNNHCGEGRSKLSKAVFFNELAARGAEINTFLKRNGRSEHTAHSEGSRCLHAVTTSWVCVQ